MKSARDLLEDILEECHFLISQRESLDLYSFMSDEVKKRAFARSVEIIGEAVKGLPNEIVTAHPGIPWRRIAGMRDRLIHAYFAVDYAILFDVTTTSVPELARQIDELLKSMDID
ncbi:MAG: DUF86 domain-containing protein [Treponema sp.]|nr:DUF86 domain-containing protein [Treponema sp.]